jgi:hypothetical protein
MRFSVHIILASLLMLASLMMLVLLLASLLHVAGFSTVADIRTDSSGPDTGLFCYVFVLLAFLLLLATL